MSTTAPTVTTVFGTWPGPVHAAHTVLGFRQAWCGVRPQLRHSVYAGTREEVTCKGCLSALRKGQPAAWRKR